MRRPHRRDRLVTIGLDRKLLAAVERLGRAWRAARQRQASLHNLSLLAVDILETLSDGRPRRVGAIAAELDIAQPTVSDALTPLDTRGLIRRERDVADRRSTVVTLSKTGRALARTIEAELAQMEQQQEQLRPESTRLDAFAELNKRNRSINVKEGQEAGGRLRPVKEGEDQAGGGEEEQEEGGNMVKLLDEVCIIPLCITYI